MLVTGAALGVVGVAGKLGTGTAVGGLLQPPSRVRGNKRSGWRPDSKRENG